MRVDATALNVGNKTKSRKMFAGGEMCTVCQATGLVKHACFMTIWSIHLFSPDGAQNGCLANLFDVQHKNTEKPNLVPLNRSFEKPLEIWYM